MYQIKTLKTKFVILLLIFSTLVIVGVGLLDIRTIKAITAPADIPNPLEAGTIPELLNAIASFLLVIAIPLLTVMVLWAGFLFLTSGGDPKKVQTARNALIWAAVGFAVILINKGIALVIKEILGGGA